MDAIINWAEAHSLWLLLAAGVTFTAVWLLLRQKRLRISWYIAIVLALLHVLIGVVTVKVFAFMETGFDANSLGNMSLFGGVFIMPLVYWLDAKLLHLPMTETFDLFTPCMIFTMLCARVNCIISGCCIGRPIPGTDGLRYPTREAELLFYVVLLLCLIPQIRRRKSKGSAYPIYLIAYGAFRFVVEFFRRSDSTGFFHLSHIWALVSLIAGIIAYVEVKKPKKQKKQRR